jgi:uncharacterized phage-associated protein
MSRSGNMYFNFGPRKIVEAIAVIIRASDHSDRPHMGRLRLLKLLYIADRESLREIGSPIIGTKPVAMSDGPLHSEAYDIIKGTRWDAEEWSEFLYNDGNEVVLAKNPGVLNLSRYEIEKLTETVGTNRDKDEWELVEMTHKFQEWINNRPEEGHRKDIPMDDLIDAVGLTHMKEDILREIEETRRLNSIFGMPS